MRFIFLYAAFLIFCGDVVAQHTTQHPLTLRRDDSLYNDFLYKGEFLAGERLNMPFPALGTRSTIDGQQVDLDHFTRPAVIMIGFADCPPCRAQMPLLLAFAADSAYRQVDFIYLTYDDADYIKKELNGQPYGRLKICSVDRDVLTGDDPLVISFPTVYFINAAGLTRRMASGIGGDETALRNTRYKWRQYLQLVLPKE